MPLRKGGVPMIKAAGITFVCEKPGPTELTVMAASYSLLLANPDGLKVTTVFAGTFPLLELMVSQEALLETV